MGAHGFLLAMGDVHATQGRYVEAEAAFRELLELVEHASDPDSRFLRLTILYNLGCVAALRGDRSGALGYLAEFVEDGRVCGGCRMETDSDLDSLRGAPEFEAILARDRENRKRAAASD